MSNTVCLSFSLGLSLGFRSLLLVGLGFRLGLGFGRRLSRILLLLFPFLDLQSVERVLGKVSMATVISEPAAILRP